MTANSLALEVGFASERVEADILQSIAFPFGLYGQGKRCRDLELPTSLVLVAISVSRRLET